MIFGVDRDWRTKAEGDARAVAARVVKWVGCHASALSSVALAAVFVSVFCSSLLQHLAKTLAWLAVLGAGLERRWAGPPRPAGLPRGLVAPLILFVAASGLSASLSIDPASGWSIIGKEVTTMGLALAGASVTRAAHARVAMACFVVGAAVAGVRSIYQFIVEFDWVVDAAHRAYTFRRPFDFVTHGEVLAIAFGVALGLAVWSGRRLRNLAVVCGGMAVIGMVLSYTRASWVASTLLAVGVLAWKRAVVPLLLILALIAAVVASPARTDNLQSLAARVRSIVDLDSKQNRDRLVRYRVAAAVIRDYPLLGTGPRVLRHLYPKYALPGAVRNWHLHNQYLQLLAERGPLGLGAWLLAVFWALARLLRSARRAPPDRVDLVVGVGLGLAAMLVVGTFSYPWGEWRVRALTLALIGLAWSPAVSGAEGERRAVQAT